MPGRNWQDRAKIELSNIPGILRAVSGVDIDRESVVRWDLINNRAGDAGNHTIKQLLS